MVPVTERLRACRVRASQTVGDTAGSFVNMQIPAQLVSGRGRDMHFPGAQVVQAAGLEALDCSRSSGREDWATPTPFLYLPITNMLTGVGGLDSLLEWRYLAKGFFCRLSIVDYYGTHREGAIEYSYQQPLFTRTN